MKKAAGRGVAPSDLRRAAIHARPRRVTSLFFRNGGRGFGSPSLFLPPGIGPERGREHPFTNPARLCKSLSKGHPWSRPFKNEPSLHHLHTPLPPWPSYRADTVLGGV